MIEINILQKEIKQLVKKINNKHKHNYPELISYLKAIEEFGEITPILLSTQIDSRKGKKIDKTKVKQKIAEEIADTIIALISLANDFDANMEKAIEKKMQKHIQRQKEKEKK